MKEYRILNASTITEVRRGDELVQIPQDGLEVLLQNRDLEPIWKIYLTNGRVITIEPACVGHGGEDYIFVPNQKTISHDGFTRLLRTDRGPRGATEYAVVSPGFHFDGSYDRAAISIEGEEVLVFPERPAKE